MMHLDRFLRQCALFVLLLYTLFFFYHSFRCLIFPFPIGFVEGESLARVVAYARSESLFDPSRTYFVPPPLHPMGYYIFTALFSGTSLSYFAGRLISILATVFAAGIIGLLTVREKGSRESSASIFGAALFLTNLAVYQSGPHHAPDFFALALGLASVLLFTGSSERSYPMGSAILAACAVHSKQPMMLYPVAIVLSGIVCRRWRNVAIFSVAFVIALVAGFAIGGYGYWFEFLRSTGGHWKLHSHDSLIFHLRAFFLTNIFLVILGAIGFFKNLSAPSHAANRFLYLLGLLSLAACANPGASAHYYLCAVAGASSLASTALTSGKLVPTLLLVCHLVFSQFHIPHTSSSQWGVYPPTGMTPSASDIAPFEALIEDIRGRPGEVFSSELSFALLAKGTTFPSMWSLSFFGTEEFEKRVSDGTLKTLVGGGPFVELAQKVSGGAFLLCAVHKNIFGRGDVEVRSRNCEQTR